MNIKEKYQFSRSRWFRLIAVSGLTTLTVFAFYQQAQAGPITGGPGNAPFVKLGVYQGVLSIVPGNPGDSVMEIGNAGRDIKSTGSLNFFPGAGSNVYIQSGSLCFGAVGSVDCKNSWAGLGGGSQTFDQVLAAGNTASNKSAIFLTQATDGKSLVTTSGVGAPIQTSTDSFAFLVPKLSAVSATHYNDVVVPNDSGLFFSDDTGFVVGGWNLPGTGARLKGARFNGANVTGAALAVNNQPNGWVTSGLGSVGDGVYAKVNSTNAAISGEQLNNAGWAGYFSGNVNVTGGLTASTVTTNTLTLGGRYKPTSIEVCQVGTDTCLGKYSHTTSPGDKDNEQVCYARNNCVNPYFTSYTRDCYNPIDDGTAPAAPFVCKKLYNTSGPTQTCPRNFSILLSGGTSGTSYYTTAGCAASDEYRVRIPATGSLTNPYRNTGIPNVCVSDLDPNGPPVSQPGLTFAFVKNNRTGGACGAISPAAECGGLSPCNLAEYYKIVDFQMQTVYTQNYELR